MKLLPDALRRTKPDQDAQPSANVLESELDENPELLVGEEVEDPSAFWDADLDEDEEDD